MNTVVREFVDSETMDGLLLVLEPVGEDIGKDEGYEDGQGQCVLLSRREVSARQDAMTYLVE